MSRITFTDLKFLCHRREGHRAASGRPADGVCQPGQPGSIQPGLHGTGGHLGGHGLRNACRSGPRPHLCSHPGSVSSRDRESGNTQQSLACSAAVCPCRLESGSSAYFTMSGSNQIILAQTAPDFVGWTPQITVSINFDNCTCFQFDIQSFNFSLCVPVLVHEHNRLYE